MFLSGTRFGSRASVRIGPRSSGVVDPPSQPFVAVVVAVVDISMPMAQLGGDVFERFGVPGARSAAFIVASPSMCRVFLFSISLFVSHDFFPTRLFGASSLLFGRPGLLPVDGCLVDVVGFVAESGEDVLATDLDKGK
ncbi:hypothetical protein PGQ11_007997 [Apiospora arundinis]|uniref:Uncharacterized protein n=1 Tax=Apiospora arundinis TaxID=335852 RepID=A0ABR2IX68_9PEZI